jgi:hypothetical protein
VDQKKQGITLTFMDCFEAKMPDDCFKGYNPFRDIYARVTKDMMMQNIIKVFKRGGKNLNHQNNSIKPFFPNLNRQKSLFILNRNRA